MTSIILFEATVILILVITATLIIGNLYYRLLYLKQELDRSLNTCESSILIQDSLAMQIHFLQKSCTELTQQIDTAETRAEQELKSWKITAEKQIRADANKRSRDTLRGKITEHLAPLMIEGYESGDFRFLGSPIDFLICAGASAITDGVADTITEVLLVDIKTGKSQLTKVQRRIRDAVVAGKTIFATYNPDTNTLKKWKNE